MSKINEMIKELCPNGVVELRLGDVCAILNGYAFQSKKYVDEGYRVIRISDVQSGYISDKDKVFYPCELHNEFKRQELFLGDLVMSLTGNPGRVALIGPNDIPCALNQRVACLRVFPEKCLTKYLFYTFNSPKFEEIAYANSNGGGQKNLSTTWLSNYEIPLPPIPIQREIVNILDKFSSLIDNLDETIQLRQKQYEYYREKLLTFKDGECEWKKLGDCCNVQAGGTPSRKNENYWKNGTIKWLGSTVCQNVSQIDTITDYITEEGYNKSSARLMHDGTTLIALVGATIGKTAYLTFDATINQNIAGVFPMDTNELSSRYIYYYSHKWYNEFTKLGDGKMAMANMSFVRGLVIPVPPLNRQQEIVATLDKFEALISNLKQERELRQKQYEYYREKLLTFE